MPSVKEVHEQMNTKRFNEVLEIKKSIALLLDELTDSEMELMLNQFKELGYKQLNGTWRRI